MREAVILIRKAQSERVYEVIHNVMAGHQHDIRHTDFGYFDDKEIVALIVEARAEDLDMLEKMLRGEFSNAAYWMKPIITGSYTMNAGAFADRDAMLPAT